MYKFPQNSPKFSKFPRNSRQSLLKAKNSPKLKIVLDNLLKLWYTGQGVKKYRLFTTAFGAEKIIVYLLLRWAQQKLIKVFHVEQ
jgi:hypothetical protein